MSDRDEGRDPSADRRLRLVDDRTDDELAREAAEIARAERMLQSAVGGGDIAAADNEVLIAMILGDDVAQVDHDEQQQAEELRMALERDLDHPLVQLAGALRWASVPIQSELLPEDNQALMAIALGEEALDEAARQTAAELGLALDGDAAGYPLAELAESLRAAAGFGDIDEVAVERAIRLALSSLSQAEPGRPARRMMLGTLVAIAAGITLFVGSLATLEPAPESSAQADTGPAEASIELVRSRSTTALFDPLTSFPRTGGESDRIGKIVVARAADLRANRFAAWGVK